MQIIDNFFDDPYKIRNIGLKGTYYINREFRWPGYRWDPPEEFRKFYLDKVSSILNEKLVLDYLHFQYIDKSWVCGMCHPDSPPHKYTCLTYLTPDPPSNSGTEVYEAGCPKNANVNGITKETFYRSDRGIMKRWFYKRDMEKYNSAWNNPCIVANKFNRTLLFDSIRYHRAQNFFGNTIGDSRFTLIGFLSAA